MQNKITQNKLKELLNNVENPKLEFKSQWYSGSEKLDDKGWGEFLKDLITLANGNLGFVHQTGYLVIGASDTDPQDKNPRELFHIDSNGMLSDLQGLREQTLKKLSATCSPPISNIQMEFVEVEGKSIFIISIPSPADVVKLDRDLNSRGMRFRKGTVLIRVGQDVGVADPTETDTLRRSYQKNFEKLWNQDQKVVHNLPQRDYVNFVGRQGEIDKLQHLLSPRDRIWTIVIDGIGGIGKSTLALEVAYHYLSAYDFLPDEERFRTIIWVSAKDTTLTSEGIKKRFNITKTLDDIYKQIAIVLGDDQLTKSDLREQGLLINRALVSQRTLLIIDNLETIDDDNVNAFIRELPNPTKCIVTTRHRIDIADPIRLSAMPRADAFLLIRQECCKKGVKLDDKHIERLYKRTAGVPLAVVWSIAQISYRGFGIDRVLERLGDAKGDIARFCFESAVQHIQNKPAYKILISIALSPRPMKRREVGKITDLSELDRDEGLADLEGLSLINRKSDNFSILHLIKKYILSTISDFCFDDLSHMVIRFTENYAPSGADVIFLIENSFNLDKMDPLKAEVTARIAEQLWDWDAQYDELGVGYCMAALENLATEVASDHIKHAAMYSNISFQVSWMYEFAVSALSRFEKIEDLIDLGTQSHFNCDIDLYLNSLKNIGVDKFIEEIDNRLEKPKYKHYFQALKKLRDRLL
jgi:hypothetical protein